MLAIKQEQAFNEFQNVTRYNNILESKTTIMLHFAEYTDLYILQVLFKMPQNKLICIIKTNFLSYLFG